MAQKRTYPVMLYSSPRLHRVSRLDTTHVTMRFQFVTVIDGHVRNNVTENNEFDDLWIEAHYRVSPEGVEQFLVADVHYREPYSVNYARAQGMAKLLRKLDQKLPRTAPTLGEFVAEVCRRLKVDGIVCRYDDSPTSDYDEMHHRTSPRRAITDLVNTDVEVFMQQFKPPVAAQKEGA